jgi:G3E family GTPase
MPMIYQQSTHIPAYDPLHEETLLAVSRASKIVENMGKVPVTVITGILGSGKTTLLQNILRGGHGKKIAVIQNEVSEEMGIESPALTDGSGAVLADFFELPNGCICCSAKEGLILAIERLVEISKAKPIDAILVETTGIADPNSVAEVFWVDSESEVYLNGIVTLVDSLNIDRFLAESNSSLFSILGQVAVKQIVAADAIVVNKTDLVESTGPIIETLKSLNPSAKLVVTTLAADVPIEWLFELNAFEKLNGVLDRDESSHLIDHYLGIDHIMVKANTPLDKSAVEKAVGKILWERKGGDVYRCKGVFRDSENAWWILQGVGEIFEVKPLSGQAEIAEPGRFLFVGADLDGALLTNLLLGFMHS